MLYNTVLALPMTCNEFIFLDEHTKPLNGEIFLINDSGQNDKHMLSFASKCNLHLLLQSDQWFADGTFMMVPLLFYQLYTLHGLKGKVSVPMVSLYYYEVVFYTS